MAAGKKPAPKPTKKKQPTKKKAQAQSQELPEDIWEQYPDENAEQYAKFCAYRDMAYQDGRRIGRRSIRRLCTQLQLKARQPMEVMSSKFDWVARCEAYDLDVDRKSREKQEEAIIKMREDHATLAAQMLRKATKRLLTIPEEEIGATDIVRLVDVGVKIERLSRGESTENQKITGELTHAGKVTVEAAQGIDLSHLSDEELNQLESILGKLHQKPGI